MHHPPQSPHSGTAGKPSFQPKPCAPPSSCACTIGSLLSIFFCFLSLFSSGPSGPSQKSHLCTFSAPPATSTETESANSPTVPPPSSAAPTVTPSPLSVTRRLLEGFKDHKHSNESKQKPFIQSLIWQGSQPLPYLRKDSKSRQVVGRFYCGKQGRLWVGLD